MSVSGVNLKIRLVFVPLTQGRRTPPCSAGKAPHIRGQHIVGHEGYAQPVTDQIAKETETLVVRGRRFGMCGY